MRKPRSVIVCGTDVTYRERAERAGAYCDPVRHFEAVEVGVVDLWVLANLGSGWQAAYRLVEQDGGVVVGEVRVHPIPCKKSKDKYAWAPGDWAGAVKGLRATVPQGGITASVLKSVRIGAHVTECRTDLSPLLQASSGPPAPPTPLDVLRIWGVTRMEKQPPSSHPTAGTLGLPQGVYRHLVDAYTAAIRGGSRRPIQDAATALGITPALARDRIHRARSRGLLGPTRKGRAGGTRLPIPSVRPETQAADIAVTLRRSGRSAN